MWWVLSQITQALLGLHVSFHISKTGTLDGDQTMPVGGLSSLRAFPGHAEHFPVPNMGVGIK